MKKYRYHLGIIIVWIIIILCIDPRGEFPINDDWAYAHNARELSENGRFVFSWWPAMTLVGQTLWSTLFTKIFGFSLFTLRLSSLVIGIGTSFAMFELVKRIVGDQRIALLATFTFFACPLLLNQSFTYMTEMPFLFFITISLIGYIDFIKKNSLKGYILAMIFTLLALLVRQTALIMPIAFLFATLPKHWGKWKLLLLSVLPVLLGLGTLSIYKEWRLATGYPLFNYSEVGTLFRSISELDFKEISVRLGLILYYLGFIVIPFIPVLIRRYAKPTAFRFALFVASAIAIIYTTYVAKDFFPYGNIIKNFEIGPKLLKNLMYGDQHGAGLPPFFWTALKLINVISLLIFVYTIFMTDLVKEQRLSLENVWAFLKENSIKILFIIWILGELAYLVINPIFFDRYTLTALFVALLLAAYLSREFTVKRDVLVFMVPSTLMIVSMLLVRDSMEWQRARWKGIEYLTEEKGVPHNEIDGGVEFNAWFGTAPMSAPTYVREDVSCWFVDKDNYLISSKPVEKGYFEVKAFATNQLISSASDSIYVLRRHEPR